MREYSSISKEVTEILYTIPEIDILYVFFLILYKYKHTETILKL